ncbi:MAG: ATP-binding cassette domain-containing protein [Deltaproteobacteria bacterium]|nr:ATP-binding cassette domain-containing protein [Deltaproteobacteria bacterium]
MNQASLLKIDGLSYGTPDGRPLVKGLDVDLGSGQILAVTGPNGTGKSTLLQVLLGAHRALSGTVSVRATTVGYLAQLQNREFHIPMTLADVMAIHNSGSFSRVQATGLGLLDTAALSLSWNTASGGERQKTLLTQILLSKPQLLVLDEPTNHLDAKSRSHLLGLLDDYVASGDRSIIIVCHEKLITEHSLHQVKVLDLSKFAS